MRFLCKNGPGDLNRISVISLNYDVCLDLALTLHRIPFDYCLHEKSGEPSVRLLKLHGSLNWARCPGCQKTVAWKVHQYLNNRMWNTFGGGEKVTVSIGSKIHEFIHCGGEGPKEPFLVPPTWNKGQHFDEVGLVWRAAAAQLMDAENIFVCGYSLPKNDHFFHYLYALGSVGDARFKRFWVFNPEPSVEQNFLDIIGPSAKNRFQFFPITFDAAVDKVRTVLLNS